MTRSFKLAAIAAAAFIAAPAFAAAALDANAEFDTGIKNQGIGSFQGGRIETNISGKAEANGMFIAGRGTLILAKSGSAGVDDAWVQLGSSAVDVKLGRFEASDLYGTPGDVIRLGSFYQTNLLRGRSTYSAAGADDRVHAALTANLAPGTSLEVGLVDKKTLSGANDAKGIRPTISFAAGAVNGRVGFETGKVADGAGTASFTGFGATVAAGVGNGLTVRANLANGSTKLAAGTVKSSSFLAGVDVGAANINVETGKIGAVKTTGFFVAYSIPFAGIKGASITPAVGSASVKNGAVKTTTTGAGVRVHYDF